MAIVVPLPHTSTNYNLPQTVMIVIVLHFPPSSPNRHTVHPATLDSLTHKTRYEYYTNELCHKLYALIPVHAIVVPSLPPAPAPPPPGQATVEEVL